MGKQCGGGGVGIEWEREGPYMEGSHPMCPGGFLGPWALEQGKDLPNVQQQADDRHSAL